MSGEPGEHRCHSLRHKHERERFQGGKQSQQVEGGTGRGAGGERSQQGSESVGASAWAAIAGRKLCASGMCAALTRRRNTQYVQAWYARTSGSPMQATMLIRPRV